ncbi:MAG: amidase family protein [Actinomycetaceae bacterium]|nr:amidase family protein [Actinomycetaceae bacterium]
METHPQNLAELSVSETVALIHSGALTARQSAEAALERAKNNPFNAFEVVTAELARTQAKALDALSAQELRQLPLAGVPVAIKAENAIAGLPTTYGGQAQTTAATAHSEVVRKLIAAGALIIGTTRMPEFGQFPFTESPHWGSVTNPVAPGRTTGGSSGGSAAVVAGGIVPAAVGGDGGGSIRIPAAACGLVGLKPVRGRVSAAPETDLWGALGVIGVLTRTVADTALLYDVISGATSGDRYRAPAWEQPLQSAYQSESGNRKLRIGWCVTPFSFLIKLDPEVKAVLEKVKTNLEAAGHQVVDIGSWPDARSSFFPQFFAALAAESRRVENPQRLEKRTRQSVQVGKLVSSRLLARAEAKGAQLAQKLPRKYAAYDVLISPTLACVPGEEAPLGNCGALTGLLRSIPMAAFTGLANVTGAPAVSLPAGLSADGVPIGMQVSVFGKDEAELIRFARLWEDLRAGVANRAETKHLNESEPTS